MLCSARAAVGSAVQGLTRGDVVQVLKGSEYFGKYGKIKKVTLLAGVSQHAYCLPSSRALCTATSSATGTNTLCVQISVTWNNNSCSARQASAAAYVLYHTEDEAWNCIQSIDGAMWSGKQVRACYGTTKYCHSYLRKAACSNPECSYLHEPGEFPLPHQLPCPCIHLHQLQCTMMPSICDTVPLLA